MQKLFVRQNEETVKIYEAFARRWKSRATGDCKPNATAWKVPPVRSAANSPSHPARFSRSVTAPFNQRGSSAADSR